MVHHKQIEHHKQLDVFNLHQKEQIDRLIQQQKMQKEKNVNNNLQIEFVLVCFYYNLVDGAPNPLEEYMKDCPTGLYRLFLTNATQTLFNLKSDEDITQEDNIRVIPRQQILDDLSKRNAGSDFHPLKQLIEDFQSDEVSVIYDYDFQYDKNFYICLNNDLKTFMNMVKWLALSLITNQS